MIDAMWTLGMLDHAFCCLVQIDMKFGNAVGYKQAMFNIDFGGGEGGHRKDYKEFKECC